MSTENSSQALELWKSLMSLSKMSMGQGRSAARAQAAIIAQIQDRPTGPGPTCRSVSGPSSRPDRKSTRLNSSHSQISYAVFCLKKKKNITHERLFTYALNYYICCVNHFI